ncbi:MAG: two-component hybrid sensor and regulator histidine kinase, partial [uncultured bacterium]
VLDNSLPELDLPHFLANRAASHPDETLTPAIILTQPDSGPPFENLQGCPRVVVLNKPLKQSYLFEAIVTCLETADATPACTSPPPRENDKKQFTTLKGKQVLVVEDDPVNQMVTSQLLTRAGILVDIAGNGHEALAALQKKTYDAVLMDVIMPKMDGLTATKAIRQSLRLDLPIIALTANAIKGDREKCLAAGMDAYLTKPVEIQSMYQILEKFTAVRP